MVHLGRRINLDIKEPLHEARDRFLKFGRSVIRIASVLGFVNLLGHDGPNRLVGHLVILADPKVNQLPLGMLGQRFPLGSFDLFELIDFGIFTVVHTADPLGKHFLKVRVGH